MRDNKLIPPAFSAILIKPMNNAMIPISPRLMLTALLHVSMIPSDFFTSFVSMPEYVKTGKPGYIA
jgi:hypothetical protein